MWESHRTVCICVCEVPLYLAPLWASCGGEWGVESDMLDRETAKNGSDHEGGGTDDFRAGDEIFWSQEFKTRVRSKGRER